MTHPTDSTDNTDNTDARELAIRDAWLAELWPVVRELPRWQRELAQADSPSTRAAVHNASTEVA